jgi:hypothetical protein
MYIRLVAWLALGSSAKSAAAIRAFTCMVISLTVKENRECSTDRARRSDRRIDGLHERV